MKLLEWNINQRGGNGKVIPEYVIEEIDNSLDIIVLTEFNRSALNIDRFHQILKERNFIYIESHNSSKFGNDVLIAVKNEFNIVNSNFIDAYPKGISDINIPENLKVDIEVEGKRLSILGIRIKELNSNYLKRKEQMQTLIKCLDNAEYPTIVSGDFNNNKEDTREKRWNLNVMDQMLNNILKKKYKRYTPNVRCSWGLSFYCFNNTFDGYIKNDHVIVSEDVVVKEINYDWNFVQKNQDIYRMSAFVNKYGQRTVQTPVGCPDHAKLLVQFEFK